jgi:hypothetical protein
VPALHARYAERLAAWAPILGMLPLMGIAGAVSEARDVLFHDPNAKPTTDDDRVLRIARAPASRARSIRIST